MQLIWKVNYKWLKIGPRTL